MNEIRKSCQWVVNNAEYVSIDEQVLKSFAEKVIKKEMGMSIFGTVYFAMQSKLKLCTGAYFRKLFQYY